MMHHMRKDTKKGRDVTIHKIGLHGTNAERINQKLIRQQDDLDSFTTGGKHML